MDPADDGTGSGALGTRIRDVRELGPGRVSKLYKGLVQLSIQGFRGRGTEFPSGELRMLKDRTETGIRVEQSR